MKILITGHEGFIGKNMWRALEKEHDLVGSEMFDRVPYLEGFDLVIHLGAISSTVEQDVQKILYFNLDYTILLFEECIKHGVDFQWASSASVYGLESNFREDTQLRPQNHYARSKYLIEKYIETRDAPIRWQGFRYFNVYGPMEEHKRSQASPFTQFEQQAKSEGVIKLFKNSDKYLRDFIHVDQIIDYHKKFFDVKDSGIWNLGTGRPRSFQEVAEDIAEIHSAEIQYIDMPEVLKGNYQEYTCADLTKLMDTLDENSDNRFPWAYL